MGQVRKYGSAKEWFTFSVSVLSVGILLLGGSWVPTAFLLPYSWLFRALGLGLIGLGIAVAVWGAHVWRYNLKHDEQPTAVVVGSPSPQENEWASLTRRRDELKVERAGLEAHVVGGAQGIAYLLASTRTEDIERRAALARAQERTRQIDAELEAIERTTREKIRESQTASAHIKRELDRKR